MSLRSGVFGFICLCLAFLSGAHANELKAEVNSHIIELKAGFSPYTSYASDSFVSYPTTNPAGGVRYQYFLGRNFGLFGGVDAQTRGFELNSGNIARPLSIDIPLGVSFRNTGSLGLGQMTNVMKVGGFVSLPVTPLKDYGDLVIAQGRITFGAMAEFSALFPIAHRFSIGPSFGIKFGMGNPFRAEARQVLVNSVRNFLEMTGGVNITMDF